MDLHIRGHGIPVSDDLRRFADKRVAKLDHLLGNVVDAKLELRSSHNRVGPDIVTAQLTIQTGRRMLRAEERDADALAAIDRAADKLDRQVRRFHDKRADRKGPSPESIRTVDAPGLDDPGVDADEADEAEGDDDRRLGLVRTKRFPVKPMHVAEAIEQMELLGHDFYLFHNADEDNLSVVYRRRDGAYGLLSPARG